MRKRIQQLARGKFQYARPLLSFSADKVDIEVTEDRDYTGDFIITSTNHVPFRGVVYTSDSRMECLTPQFEGEEVRIRYQFHSNGLIEGDIVKGDFFLICNQGEYNLSFVVSVSRLYADTSAGRIKNLNDFTGLAKSSAQEAYHLFYSGHFKNILKPSEVRERLLYDGEADGTASWQKVEEYLRGCRQKKPVAVTLLADHASFEQVAGDRRESLKLHRDEWGYLSISIESDAPFLLPEKSQLTDEDFIGSTLEVPYYVKKAAMHAGKNFGRLSIVLPEQTLTFEVCATTDGAKAVSEEHLELQRGRMRLAQLYIDYRLKKIVTGAWANQSVELLDHMMAMEPECEMYALMKAQALIVNRQKQEASWIMEDYKRGCRDRETPEWGYYLYLCTLIEREPSYVDKLTDEMELLFKKNPKSSLLFWILLFLRESYYYSSPRKYKAIEAWIEGGCSSPYLYLESYYLIWQDPYLLTRLGTYELKVLRWAMRQGVLTKELAQQIRHLLPEVREKSRVLYEILEAAYQVEPEEEMLSAICAYLIRTQCYETEYHRWYELGIEQKIRLTGLYEAYLMSLDAREVGGVPRMIQMYFQYDSTLSYTQKAVLFVNIIAARTKQPEVYQKYQRTMEQFAMAQIEAGHINDHLAVIYDEMLPKGILDEELAHSLAPLLFTHRISCTNRQIARAIIWHEEMKMPQSVSFVNGTAYFKAYTPQYSIVLEDTNGNRFCSSVVYQDEALMYPERYVGQCLSLAPGENAYLLWHMSRHMEPEAWSDTEKTYALQLLQSGRLSRTYLVRLALALISYEKKDGRDFSYSEGELDLMKGQLAEALSDVSVRRQMAALLTENHLYEKAYQMVQIDGYDYLKTEWRVSLCSYAIADHGYEEDDFLLGFAESTFRQGKYSDVMLIYLCKYFNGPTKQMAELWKAAGEFQIDTFDLEERILTQMLYTTDYTPHMEEIYESYCAGGGRDLVCMAYLSYFANMYLTEDAVVPEHVFRQIRERYLTGGDLNRVCRIALLKYLSENHLSERDRKIADELLDTCIRHNLYFAFFRKFDEKLLRKYQLTDKFFLEYHTAPGQQIEVHYRLEAQQEYLADELTEMYDGIYVKDFILFFGEKVQYYILESQTADGQIGASGCLGNGDIMEEGSGDRYAWLNEMLLACTLDDREKLAGKMKRYYGMTKVTEEAYRLL